MSSQLIPSPTANALNPINRWSFLLLLIGSLFQACQNKEPNAAPPTSALFTFQLVAQGDGLVAFSADSSQTPAEFIWDFGDSTAHVTTTSAKTTHQFTKNSTYQVKLTIKYSTPQRTSSQPVTINTRLARAFADLPLHKRDTIRLLYILTDQSYASLFDSPTSYHYDNYQNQLFINFMKRSDPNRHLELDRLVFKHIIYKLSSEEMNRFNQEGDPVNFMYGLFTNPNDPLTQKLLALKQKEAVSRLVFFLKDPRPNGYPKYGFGGFATYEGGYFVLLSQQATTAAHELGHSFGLAHDTLRDCECFPLMIGSGLRTQGTCGSIWNEYPEFQVKGYVNQLVLLEARPARGYQYAVPDYWRSQFPQDVVVNNFTYVYPANTPYYRSGISVSQTLTDALITQYNYELAPRLVNSLEGNPKAPSGRLAANDQPQTIYCQP